MCEDGVASSGGVPEPGVWHKDGSVCNGVVCGAVIIGSTGVVS